MMAKYCSVCQGMVGIRVLLELEGKVCEAYCLSCGRAQTLWISHRYGAPLDPDYTPETHHPRLPVG